VNLAVTVDGCNDCPFSEFQASYTLWCNIGTAKGNIPERKLITDNYKPGYPIMTPGWCWLLQGDAHVGHRQRHSA